MNVGPTPDGSIPDVQAGIMNEIALWMFINREAFENTVPHDPIRENDVWFLQSADGKTVYVFLPADDWELRERREFLLSAQKVDENASISLLGHNGKVLEYSPDADPAPRMEMTRGGLKLSVMRAQRIYNDLKWHNPQVVKISIP